MTKPEPAASPDKSTLIEQAETRTEQANLRTAEANTRTAEANTRTEQADLRTEKAETQSEALRTSELSYRRLFETCKAGILILDLRQITDRSSEQPWLKKGRLRVPAHTEDRKRKSPCPTR